jgi:transposase
MAEDPHLSMNAAVLRIGSRVGVESDRLRSWVKQARVDVGLTAGTTTSDAARLKALECLHPHDLGQQPRVPAGLLG